MLPVLSPTVCWSSAASGKPSNVCVLGVPPRITVSETGPLLWSWSLSMYGAWWPPPLIAFASNPASGASPSSQMPLPSQAWYVAAFGLWNGIWFWQAPPVHALVSVAIAHFFHARPGCWLTLGSTPPAPLCE
jgi:hypothetical protein